MAKTTQSQVAQVREKLLTDGYVDNFWAIKNRILRLGAVMYTLRPELPFCIDGQWGNRMAMYSAKDKVKNRKNYHYYIYGVHIINNDGDIERVASYKNTIKKYVR